MKKKIYKVLIVTAFTVGMLFTCIHGISNRNDNRKIQAELDVGAYINDSTEGELTNFASEEYSSWFYFPFETIKYVDDEAYTYIKEIYEELDLSSEFKVGDITSYESYKKIYMQLLAGDIPFYLEKGGEKIYLPEYSKVYIDDRLNDICDVYDVNEYIYELFDMDGDDFPELCMYVTDDVNSLTIEEIIIFKYDIETDKITLWAEWNACPYIGIYGSRKVIVNRYGVEYRLCFLGENGETEASIYLYQGQPRDVPVYMVSIPMDDSSVPMVEMPQSVKNQTYRVMETYFFNLTEEQYYELVGEFHSERKKAEEYHYNSYSYKELFEE